MIKIFHTADVHLDSPFTGLNPRSAELRRNELRQTFMSMMTAAKRAEADIMLIAGDLFDGASVSRDTVRMLCREFETFGRPVFIAPGNHDPASPGSVWQKVTFPENVHVFTSTEPEGIDLADEDGADTGVTVYGFGFTAPDLETVPIAGWTADDPDRINLLVCHCDMTAPKSTDCPVTPAHLTAFGADYAALGHIHNPPSPGPDNRWAYPGCPEPRGFDECGPKGAIIAQIEKKDGVSAVALRRIRFSRRRYEKADLDCTGCDSNDDVRLRVRELAASSGWGNDTLCSLRLTGFVSPALLIDTETLSEEDFGLFSLRLTDDTRPDASPDEMAADPGIRGALWRELEPEFESADPRRREVALRALRYALSALSGDRV